MSESKCTIGEMNEIEKRRLARAPAPDWYPDPRAPQLALRYWDGQRWTGHVAPMAAPRAQGVVMMKPKSPALAFVLAFLFGAFGLLYLSARDGGVGIGLTVLIVLMLGMFSCFLTPFVWIGCMIYAPMAASSINQRIARAEALGVIVV